MLTSNRSKIFRPCDKGSGLLALSAISAVIFLASAFAIGQIASTRVLVYKNPTPSRPLGSVIQPFQPVVSPRLAQAGFTLLADYTHRSLYEGPADAAVRLVGDLRAEGHTAFITDEFDKIPFNQYQVDVGTGNVIPPVPQTDSLPPGRDGLFLLALRGYPTAAWLGDLARRNVRLIEALPPGGYLVRAEKAKIDTIKAEAPYVRGVFPLTPGMKIAPLPSPASPGALRRVAITVVEETPEETLANHLQTISEGPVILEDRLPGGKTIYVASLTGVDAENLTQIGHVYSVAGIAEPQPSAERQGMLALAPVLVGGRLELPSQLTGSQNYWSLLNQKGISDFNLTKVAMLDTGFDNGTNTHPDFQYGGSPTVTDLLSEFGTDYADNRDGHGTVVASIIGAFTSFNQRADAEKYRYSLGLAPGVRLISDKFFSCSGSGDFSTALTRISNAVPNVVNLSWNQFGPGSCGYTSLSDTVDRRTRQHHWLFTMSAGNSFDDATCTTVRGPATARNGLTVGATESFTPSAYINIGGPAGCAWNNQPAVRDARNIPTFSLLRQEKSTVKPDLVAPGVRVTGPVTQASRCASIFCNENVETVGGVTYGMSVGTSFAAPAVAGAATVVRQWYYNLTSLLPSPALVKAILINGARDLGGPWAVPPNCGVAAMVRNQSFTPTACVGRIPDKYQGWGMLNLERLLGPATNYYFRDQFVGPILTPSSSYWETPVTVNDSTRPIRITLAYTDAPGNASLSPYVVKNDLTVGAYQFVCSPCWYANLFDGSTGWSVPNVVTHDPKNNVKQIIIPPGSYGNGTVIRVFVLGENITEDAVYLTGGSNPQQDFSLFIENAR